MSNGWGGVVRLPVIILGFLLGSRSFRLKREDSTLVFALSWPRHSPPPRPPKGFSKNPPPTTTFFSPCFTPTHNVVSTTLLPPHKKKVETRRSWLAQQMLMMMTFTMIPSASAKAQLVDSKKWPGAIQVDWYDSSPTSSTAKIPPSTTPTTTSVSQIGQQQLQPPLPFNYYRCEELISRLSHDLLTGATEKGSYLFTGDISPDLFQEDCIFIHPMVMTTTTTVRGLHAYRSQLLGWPFDPLQSTVVMVQPLQVVSMPDPLADSQPAIWLRGQIRLRGMLQYPWHPYLTALELDMEYKVVPKSPFTKWTRDGAVVVVAQQELSWSSSASRLQSWRQALTPTLFTPPRSLESQRVRPPKEEPEQVTRLWERVQGRRPNEYSPTERQEIDQILQAVLRYVDQQQQQQQGGQNPPLCDRIPERLLGTWRLVYLQPGPDGAGVDRRIPFIELPFNDGYQIFQPGHVLTNIGQLWGPLLDLRVSGTFQEYHHDSSSSSTTACPQRLQANILGGQLCAGDENCFGSLPITGQGIFDALYVGDRLRIFQNINGGGARGIQVRVS